MRRWINLMESVDWWLMSEDELREYAAQFVGYATDEMGDPDDLTFKFESQFPLIEFRGFAINWEEYFQDDVLRNSKYDRAFIEDSFHTPIVVSIEHGELFIWDGWHRIATAIHRGDEVVAAIVGRPKKQDIDESVSEWPATISGDDLVAQVEKFHHTPEDFDDGDLVQNITSFGIYHLKRVPLSGLSLHLFTIHDSLVNDYAEMDGDAPPIIVNGLHPNIIIDGNHRANAAAKRGEHDILAYVGDPATYEAPEEDEDGREKGW